MDVAAQLLLTAIRTKFRSLFRQLPEWNVCLRIEKAWRFLSIKC